MLPPIHEQVTAKEMLLVDDAEILKKLLDSDIVVGITVMMSSK